MKPRACGTCNACCVALNIDELEKAAHVPCSHLASKGCGIYEDRPSVCRGFQCLWLSGNLPAECRPDRFGVVAFGRKVDGELVANVVECAPGALNRPEVLSVIQQYAAKAPTVIVPKGKHASLVGPQSLVNRVRLTIVGPSVDDFESVENALSPSQAPTQKQTAACLIATERAV